MTHGGVVLSESSAGPLTSVAPFAGQAEEVSRAMRDRLGFAFPAPNRFERSASGMAVWTGPGQALVLGVSVDLEGAALTDQTDAWAHLVLEGGGAAEVLARLVPLDLRDAVFAEGHAARTLLFHMTATLMRTGAERWEILVFRSMAQSAVHDLTWAMRGVAGRI